MNVTTPGGPLRPIVNALHEIRAFARIAADPQSAATFAVDAFAYRALRAFPRRGPGRNREVRLKGDIRLAYRRTRGDIQTLREIWLDEIYRLPLDVKPRNVLDLGANIGFSAIWFAKTYGSTVVAVEPVHENVMLARQNVARNRVDVAIMEAAVSSEDGLGHFFTADEPNHGYLGTVGGTVRVLGIRSLIEDLGHVDLVKLDIEGGEASILSEPGWLADCDSLIVEFHPKIVDHERLIDVIVEHGFEFCPAGSVLPKAADFFVRSGSIAPSATEASHRLA